MTALSKFCNLAVGVSEFLWSAAMFVELIISLGGWAEEEEVTSRTATYGLGCFKCVAGHAHVQRSWALAEAASLRVLLQKVFSLVRTCVG